MVTGSTGGLPQASQSALLTESQSANHLGISLSTLRRWRRKGIGPRHFFLGAILRYRISDLDEFVAQHTQRGKV
jgi:predicted DNA-binding transcriptional regulator AlpA